MAITRPFLAMQTDVIFLNQVIIILLHYDFVCIFAIFSNLFGIVMVGCLLMEVTRRSNKPPSDCHCVVGATCNVSVVALFELLFNEIGSKTNSC